LKARWPASASTPVPVLMAWVAQRAGNRADATATRRAAELWGLHFSSASIADLTAPRLREFARQLGEEGFAGLPLRRTFRLGVVALRRAGQPAAAMAVSAMLAELPPRDATLCVPEEKIHDVAIDRRRG
jgi:hypothetical protein